MQQKNPRKESTPLLWSQHAIQNTRKRAALASLTQSHLFRSLKVSIEKLERQVCLPLKSKQLLWDIRGERRKTTLRKQKSKQRQVKKITISTTIIYYTNIYRR